MRKFLAVMVAAGSIALVGCGKDAVGPEDVAGTYALQTVNGQQLPFTLSEDATLKVEMLASAITLYSDMTYDWTLTERSTADGEITTTTDSFPGTYSLRGSTITLTDQEGSIDAHLSGDTMTMNIGGILGLTLVFTR